VCGCQKIKIGEEISERLEYIPAKMVVEQQVRFKYACKQCEGELAIADVPPSMIPKSNTGSDLLAFVTTPNSKMLCHCIVKTPFLSG